jgi:hypothetical protein
MATRLGALWECCWVHGIDPCNPGQSANQVVIGSSIAFAIGAWFGRIGVS